MKTTICGNYPKIDCGKSPINLRRAINHLETGRIDREEYESVLYQTIARVVDDQLRSGIDVITDGQITWTDLFSPFCDALTSVEPGGLRRFYDNNIYYRRPRIIGKITRTGPIVCNNPIYKNMQVSAPIKAVLCGPVTFALFSDDHYYRDFGRLVEALSCVMREEIRELEKLGAEYVQLDEPALPEWPEHVPLLVRVFEKMFEGTGIKKGLAFYFTPLGKILDRLEVLPVDFLALDCVSHPEDIRQLPALPGIELHAGLIDARVIMLEKQKEVLSRLAWLEGTVRPMKMLLTTSCGLEFLPRNFALKKMRHLARIAARA